MSASLVRYDNRALATGALHQSVTSNGTELQKIFEQLPPSAQVAIKILVIADPVASEDFKIYHAANVHLLRTPEGSLRVSAAFGAYEEGRYCQRIMPAEMEEAPAASCLSIEAAGEATGALADPSSSREIVMYRHPLVNQSHLKSLTEMGAKSRCPQAYRIAESVTRIFGDGVPLPRDEAFHHCTFTVAVKMPSQSIQYLSVSRGIRGIGDGLGRNGDWSSTTVIESADLKEFSELQKEAEGAVRPSGVPASAQRLSGLRGGGVLSMASIRRFVGI